MIPAIQTRRLHLRLPRPADAQWMTAGLSNFAVAGNLLVPHPYDIQMARDWLARDWAAIAPAGTCFSVDLKGNGGIGIAGFTEKAGEAVLSYWLAEPYWGRGIMTEALRAALLWYFQTTRAERVLAGVLHFNMASLSLQFKLGFAETGRSMVYSPTRGEDIEHIDTELTRDTFEALQT